MGTEWNTRTKLVHGGVRRSQYGEVSEAIFLTQGFVYDTAEDAEARFIFFRRARTSLSMRAMATQPCACSKNALRA